MPKTYRPAEVAKVLEYLGWEPRQGRGDHVNYRKRGQRGVATVDMGVREVPRGTLQSILRVTGMSRNEFDQIAEEVL